MNVKRLLVSFLTPQADLVREIGQQKIVDNLSAYVLRNRLSSLAARQMIQARNWQGAIVVLRWLNRTQTQGDQNETK